MVVVVLLFTGWWFVRNQLLYGDPFGWSTYQTVFPGDLRQNPLQWNDVTDFFTVQFRSFWGVFGWMNVAPPPWFYVPPLALGLLGLLGLALMAVRRGSDRLSGSQLLGVTLLATSVAVQQLFLMALASMCNPSCYQGRYLFPVIAPLMLLASLAITSLFPKRLEIAAISCVLLVLLGTAVFAPFWVILPAY